MWDHPGIGRYIRELSAALISFSSEYQFTFYGYTKVTGPATSASPPEGEPADVLMAGASPVTFVNTRSKVYSILEQFEIPFSYKNTDLLHIPHFNIPVFYPKKLVVTVHDLTYLHDPGASRAPLAGIYAHFLLKVISKKASAILTVSEYTKNDLLNSFPGLRPDKVFVTHEAVSPFFRKVDDPEILKRAKKTFSLEKPFVLSVGSLKPHKNIPALIRAIAALRTKKEFSHELVLVGRKDENNPELLKLMQEHSFVHYLGELGDEDILLLYNLTDVFVLPSFREGFGLPVLEAMACGAPVICSNQTSLPEVAGEAGLFFDPHKVDALEELLYNILQNNELRKKMSRAGLERVKQFSWERTAKKTLEVYRKVLG